MKHEPSAPWVRPLILACVLAALAVSGAAGDLTYQTPPQVLVDMVDAPPTPSVQVDPTKKWMLLMQRPTYPPIAELAARELRLGGLRIDPAVSGRSRTRPLSDLSLLRIADGTERPITGLPAEARLGYPSFSPDGAHIAFTHTTGEGIELWVAELATGQARRLTGAVVSQVAGVEPRWLGNDALVVTLVPEDRGPEPPPPAVPSGPVVQENLGRTAPARTYQDLLEDPHDEALFEHYMTAQVARVSLDGTLTLLGEPALVWNLGPSPDGRYLVVEALHRPFSYLVPVYRFPLRVEIWDPDGRLVRQVADLPLHEEVPIAFGSVPTGPREFRWRDDEPATLAWVEALDGGDAGAEADERDRLFQLPAPFTGDPEPLATFQLRFAGVDWGSDELALGYEWWWKTRQLRTWVFRPGEPEAAPELLFDRTFEDRYNDPGSPLTERNSWGRRVLRTGDGGKTLYYVGQGASPEGDRPFFDVLDLESKETRRLFRSQAPYYEAPVELLDEAGPVLLTRRESVEEPPDYFVRDLGSSELRQLTRFPHPTPQLLGVSKELIRYERADGLPLTATLYLPAGYDPAEDGPLPMLMWAYPVEFKSADAAGQVTDSPYRFVRVGWGSPLVWLTQGYAVLDDPSMPIVGEGEEEPNDTYVEQLVASARAAVDEVVRRGVADPRRIAIGGHSYGAFMTANLLAHSDLFAAGVARSGAYNRTLTPFGFQAEERTVWQAPEIYFEMSPFLHAEKVDEPILLIHGEADNNSGTYPMQSERFYNALKGLGATVRLVMLPHESHGYRGRESILHMLWETDRWLATYVKNREAPGAGVEAPAAGAAGAGGPGAGGRP